MPKEQEIIPPNKPNTEANTWAMLVHLSAFAGLVFPFGNIIAPLIIWLLKRDEFPLVDEHGKESLNFQISMTIYFFVSLILILVLIGIPLLLTLAIVNVVCIILATLKANVGESYHYPLSIRFLR